MSVRFSARRTVIPNPQNQNQYDMYSVPDPNAGVFGEHLGLTNDDKTGAGLMSRADEYRRNFQAQDKIRQERANVDNPRWNLGPKMIQSAPRDRRWDAFFQAMQEQGVDRLAADAVTPGGTPSFFGDQFGHSGASLPPGYTHQRALDELKKFQTGGPAPGFATTPGGAPSQMTPGTRKYAQNVLDALRRYPDVYGSDRSRYYGYR